MSFSQLILLTVLHHHLLFTFAPSSFSYPLAYFHYPPFLTPLIILHFRTFYHPPFLTSFIIFHSSHILLSSILHTSYYSPFYTNFIIPHSSHILLSSTPQTTYYPPLHPHLLSSIPRTFHYSPYFTHVNTLHSSHLLLSFIPHISYPIFFSPTFFPHFSFLSYLFLRLILLLTLFMYSSFTRFVLLLLFPLFLLETYSFSAIILTIVLPRRENTTEHSIIICLQTWAGRCGCWNFEICLTIKALLKFDKKCVMFYFKSGYKATNSPHVLMTSRVKWHHVWHKYQTISLILFLILRGLFSKDRLSVSTLPTQSVGFAGSSLSPGEASRHFTPLRVSTRCDRVHFLSWTNGKSEKRNALKKAEEEK